MAKKLKDKSDKLKIEGHRFKVDRPRTEEPNLKGRKEANASGSSPATKEAQLKPDVNRVQETRREGSQPREARAVGRYLKISPTKVRGVLDLIRRRSVGEARTILRLHSRKGAGLALKVLDSAVANAKVAGQFSEDTWFVSDARADKGPLFRRKRDPKAHGQWGMIATPSTHLRIAIKERKDNESNKNNKVNEVNKVNKVSNK